ncbi:MAG: 3-phosphoshikimate 1-carboxyvinyltransferase [Planctomycetia bacterium]|nr:3-phosphoshikimate 1-carboxyvinyltransferase [Planctomycetia bacterium]
MKKLFPSGVIHARVIPPGSKSITNRALVIAAAAEGTSVLKGVLDSEDTQVMRESLSRLGIAWRHDPDSATLWVEGCGGNRSMAGAVELYCANSGTTLRFLTAMCSTWNGTFRLDGIERMRQRPIGDLLHGLQQLGVEIRSEAENDCPPVVIQANGLRGGTAQVPGNISSQFLSGMLMAAVHAQQPTTLEVTGKLVSRPYIEMTLAVMRAFGGKVEVEGENRFLLPAGQRYHGSEYVIEPDASAASYFFAAAAVAGGEMTVENLSRNSLQGDIRFCDCLEKMGCEVEYREREVVVRRRPETRLRGLEVDMHDISDTAQTLSVVALFADSPTTIRNVANMRVKETDRIHAVVTELRKLGARVEEFPDGLKIWPLEKWPEKEIRVETWNDHRMAMSFAVAGLKIPGVVILNPECTAKTYPHFFEDWEKIRK